MESKNEKGAEILRIMAQKAVLGDEATFIDICGMLKVRLYKTAIGMLGNESLALDAVDETVYRAFKAIKKLKQPQYISTWFMRILLNVCHDILRKRSREIIVARVPEEFMTKNTNFNGYDRFQIDEMVGALPEDLKQIISMKYFSDLTLTEIAEILQIPVGTVKSKLNRALKLLRLEVEE